MPADASRSAEEAAGPLSRLTFAWVAPFLQSSYKEVCCGSLSLASLPALPVPERPDAAIDGLAAQVRGLRAGGGLHRAIWRWKRATLLCQLLVAMLCALLFVAQPLLLRSVVRAMRGEASQVHGYLCVAGMAAVGLGGGLLQQQNFHAFTHFGRQIWAGLVGIIFEQLTAMDSARPSEGKVLSMIGQDSSIFPYMAPFFSVFLVMPCNILFPAVVLFVFLREAFAVGFAVCLLTLVVSSWAAVEYRRHVTAKLRVGDERLTLVNEALQGVRSVKLCAWEPAIEARVAKVREKELQLLMRIHLCYALQQGAMAALPVLGIAATFLVQAALRRPLEADVVAMAIGFFEQMALGFFLLPTCKMQLETMSAGVSRMEPLLLQPQAQRTSSASGGQPGLELSDASFRWQAAGEPDAPGDVALAGLTLSVRPGELVAIVGQVASGKSTLAAGVFGLASLAKGQLSLVGQAAYVPQSPQILNATVRGNVLFGLPLEAARYQEALHACCLEQDLAQLADGDLTEIGEKGITISGGQRARVALARAVYADADVVVLDDPLAAMDAHVGAVVFRRCVLGLRAKGKAVLLTTNQLQLCCVADKVVVLEAGRVAEQGSFSALAARSESLFAGMLPASGDADASAGRHSAKESVVPEGKEAPARKCMTEEVALQGRIGLREWQRIAKSGHSAWLSVMLVSFCIAVPVFMFFSNLTLGFWTSAVADEADAFSAQLEVAFYIVAGLMHSLSVAGRVSVAALYFTRLSRQLHRSMLASVLRQPLFWYDTTPLGRVLNRFSQDVALMDLQLPRLFEFTHQHGSVVVVGVLGAGALAWPALVVMLLVAWPLRRIQQRYGAVSLGLQRVMLGATSPVMSQASGFLNALDTIRAFGRERLFAAKFREVMADYLRAYYWIHATDRLAMSIFTLLCIPVLTLLMGCAVLPLVRAGILTPSMGGLALSLSCGLAQRLPLFLWCNSTLEKFFGGAQRIAEYANLGWEGGHAAWIAGVSVEASTVADVPALELEGVSLRYQPELPLVLKGLSLKVWTGEKLGVCGRTGSGKSTLFLACFRAVEPEQGRVLLAGIDTQSLPLPRLRSQLAIVPQDPLMFSGTLRSNLDFHGRHDEREIWQALKLAHLEEQVKALPLGLEEPVNEKGSNFSGGTVQLLCIARTLLDRQRVVFLDECTASVDVKTDAAVQAAVRTAFEGCAVICIAHRLLTIVDYDRIACLDAGSVADTGSPHEMLQRDGLFSRLVASVDSATAAELRQRAAAMAAASGRCLA